MSRSVRLVFCLALILIAPAALSADTTCGAADLSTAMAEVDQVTGLPTTVFDTNNFFGCSDAFTTASFCHQCWSALNQCSGPNCYTCTELCLGRLGCWIP